MSLDNTSQKKKITNPAKKKLILSGCIILNDRKEVLLLYRKDHQHYETPGGKVESYECSDPKNPSREDLAKTAEREAKEELGSDIRLEGWSYFGKADFITPDGREAVAHKFLVKMIGGVPRLNEPEKFSRIDYLPIEKLEQYPLSPDLKLLLDQLRKHFKIHNT